MKNNIFQNTAYMISIAWKYKKSALFSVMLGNQVYAHDFAGHIQTLKALAENGHTHDILLYLEEMGRNLSDNVQVLRTGNRMCVAW